MNWSDLAGRLVTAGAPIIGAALGGPLGGVIGSSIGSVLASALGTDTTPEAVDVALKTTPPDKLQAQLSAAEIEAQARWPAIAEIAKAEASAEAQTLVATGETMRAEASNNDPMQRLWRPIYAFELTIECALMWAIAIGDLALGSGKIAAFITGAGSLLSVYWGARFGVLGVYVGGRSYEKATEIKAAPPLAPSAIDQIIKAIRKK